MSLVSLRDYLQPAEVLATPEYQRYVRARREFDRATRALKSAQDDIDRARADLTNAHLAFDEKILQVK